MMFSMEHLNSTKSIKTFI